ncbi:MAG: bifunctional phosphoribosyl-AMP cyclohydrolase/phosphoribosyl-ATP diphosphatase HisIE [Acidobacteriota bacterium]|nr:bifunctional phosphoribosyl-AMP cyclohydrolase/phosphoribosyl-ATP diphosphatase HisIE [Acidobacteriota bacterium]
MKIAIEDVKFDEQGLIPAIVQDARTRRVLMLAYMNAESLKRTLESNETWFWSRSRSSFWHKGETSGNTQPVVDVLVDCDGDALTVLVVPNGPACHTGAQSCFYNQIVDGRFYEEAAEEELTDLGEVLNRLYALVESRKRERPEDSYTTYLFDQGLDKILKKVGEESAETIIAAKNEDRGALVKESSDLLYHLVVLFVEQRLSLEEVSDELLRRGKKGDAG